MNKINIFCPHCNKKLSRSDSLNRHLFTKHSIYKPKRKYNMSKINEDLNNAMVVLKKAKAQETTTPEKLQYFNL